MTFLWLFFFFFPCLWDVAAFRAVADEEREDVFLGICRFGGCGTWAGVRPTAGPTASVGSEGFYALGNTFVLQRQNSGDGLNPSPQHGESPTAAKVCLCRVFFATQSLFWQEMIKRVGLNF